MPTYTIPSYILFTDGKKWIGAREMGGNWNGIDRSKSHSRSHISTTRPILRPWTELSSFKDHPQGSRAVLCVLKQNGLMLSMRRQLFARSCRFYSPAVRSVTFQSCIYRCRRWVRHIHWASLPEPGKDAQWICYSFTSSELTSGCVVGRRQRPDGNERIAGFSRVADVDNIYVAVIAAEADCARGRFVHSAANADNAHTLLNARSQILNPGVPDLSAMRAYNLAHNCPVPQRLKGCK